MKKELTYQVLLTFIYFMVSFIGILNHELWLDEAHHYLLARDSNSILELIQNTRYEGHPILWNLLLYGITRFSFNPFWMQFLHIIISTFAVYVFLKKAPFNWIFKILFIFGYFMLFEYNLISRNYILGVLFLFLACSIFEKRNEKFSLLCVYLAIASNTHIQFSVIAFALFLIVLFEQLEYKQYLKKQNIYGYLIFLIGLISIIIQIRTTNSDWLLNSINQMPISERLTQGFISLFKGIIIIPDFTTIHFWNTNIIVSLNRKIAAVLALLIYLLPLVLFTKNKKTLYFIYIGLIGTQIFFFITQRAATRFHGMTYILLIITLWIENCYQNENFKLKNFLSSIKLTLYNKQIIYIILIIHFISGIYAYSMDIVYPFTSAKETITFIKNENKERKEIITVTCDGTLLSAYLEEKIFFLCDRSLQSFCNWESGCLDKITEEKSVEMLTDYMKYRQDVLYISYYSLGSEKFKDWINLNSEIKAKFIKKFDTNIVEKSNYYIFEVSKI